MLRTIHPLTSLGLLLFLASPPLFIVGLPQVGLLLLVLAYAFSALEFKKYTSDFQFVMILICATSIGIAVDLLHHSWPMLTVALFLAAFATIARQKYMQRFTNVDLLWLDSGLALLAAVIYLGVVLGAPFSWDLLLIPMVPISVGVGLTFSYVQDGYFIRRTLRGGYQVQEGQQGT